MVLWCVHLEVAETQHESDSFFLSSPGSLGEIDDICWAYLTTCEQDLQELRLVSQWTKASKKAAQENQSIIQNVSNTAASCVAKRKGRWVNPVPVIATILSPFVVECQIGDLSKVCTCLLRYDSLDRLQPLRKDKWKRKDGWSRRNSDESIYSLLVLQEGLELFSNSTV